MHPIAKPGAVIARTHRAVTGIATISIGGVDTRVARGAHLCVVSGGTLVVATKKCGVIERLLFHDVILRHQSVTQM